MKVAPLYEYLLQRKIARGRAAAEHNLAMLEWDIKEEREIALDNIYELLHKNLLELEALGLKEDASKVFDVRYVPNRTREQHLEYYKRWALKHGIDTRVHWAEKQVGPKQQATARRILSPNV